MNSPRPQALEAIFGSVPNLSSKDLRTIYRRVTKLHLRRGDVLIQKGDKAEALFFALTGRFSVHLEEGAKPIAEIESGVPIGEVAFFAGGTRTAFVVALRDAVVLKLRRPEFDELSQLIPNLTTWLTKALAQRLRESISRLPVVEHIVAPRTIAIVRAGGSNVPDRFLHLLEQVFCTPGSDQDEAVLFIREAMVKTALPGRPSLSDPSVTAWLNAHEEKNRLVIYICDDSLSSWTRKAVRQADLIVLVGQAGDDPAINDIERFVDEHHTGYQKRLVLLHDQRRDEVEGTEHWLAERSVLMHHHVALCDAMDVARLRRFIEGTALGFVCCGGGSYCSLHVGVYQACNEANITFDIYGGASGGGAMAAAFARGLPASEIDHRIDEIFIKRKSLRKVTVPHYSILDHKPFDDALRDHYGVLRIENLWRPLYVLATNLANASPHIIKTGPIWEAVRATGSIPGLLPPFITDDGIPLVDGSIIDNVPLDAMKSLKTGPNLVVHFTDQLPANFEDDYEDIPGRGALLMHHMFPFGDKELPKLPTLATTIVRSMMVSQKKLTNVTDLDLILSPPLPVDMSVMDWRSHSQLVADGHAYTQIELDRLAEEKHPVIRIAQTISRHNAYYRNEPGSCAPTESEAALQTAQETAHQRPPQGRGD